MLQGVVQSLPQNFARSVHVFPPGHEIIRVHFCPRGLSIATYTKTEPRSRSSDSRNYFVSCQEVRGLH
eukprot:14887162-Heterocapsa_arctica.AAC.1